MFDQNKCLVFFRGEFVPFDKAEVSISNKGFLYGLSVFTGMRAFWNSEKGKIYLFRLADHYQRLRYSCKLMRFDNFLQSYSLARFTEIVTELVTINSIKEDAYIRITNFADVDGIGQSLKGIKDSLGIFLVPLGDYVTTKGARCCVSSWTRVADNAIPARAKISGCYVNSSLAKTEALYDGYDEAIFLNDQGYVLEGSSENIFIVCGGKIITPSVADHILEGITRSTVIEIARDRGIECVERPISRSELYKAEEIFMSGTAARIAPVIEVDHYPVGTGTVGPIARLIQDSYLSAARGEMEEYRHWVHEVS